MIKEILPIHYRLSKPVKKYSEIKKAAKEMCDFIWKGRLKGFYNKAYAISHCEVSEFPFAFFVVADDVLVAKMLKNNVIINPEIIEAPDRVVIDLKDNDGKVVKQQEIDNKFVCEDKCLCFPFRRPKKVERFYKIKVRYQTPALGGLFLKTTTEWAENVKALIFQHEIDHINAKNIFFHEEKPIEWWTLAGPRPKSWTSLDTKEEAKQ